MLAIQTSFYAMSLCLCLFTGLVVWHIREKLPARYFLAFLFIEVLSFSFEWLMAHPASPYKSFWLLGIMVLSLLVAPSLWMFARDLSTAQHSLTPLKSSFHFNVIGLGILLLLPLASSVHPGNGFINFANPASAGYSLFIHTTMLLMVAVFLYQSLFYLQKCLRFLHQRLEQNKSLFTQVADAGVNTLRILITVVIANFAISALRVLYCWALDDISMLNLGFSFLQVCLIAYLCFAVVVQAIDYVPANQETRDAVFSSDTKASRAHQQKYQHSSLDEERRQSISNHLESLFKDDKIYRDNRLNLDLLCKNLGELPYLVSQVINQSEYGNFYELVNSHRITEAQLLLLREPERTVLDIAYAVGYNSKSTFNTAFKKVNGRSPTDYRRANSYSQSSVSY